MKKIFSSPQLVCYKTNYISRLQKGLLLVLLGIRYKLYEKMMQYEGLNLSIECQCLGKDAAALRTVSTYTEQHRSTPKGSKFLKLIEQQYLTVSVKQVLNVYDVLFKKKFIKYAFVDYLYIFIILQYLIYSLGSENTVSNEYMHTC